MGRIEPLGRKDKDLFGNDLSILITEIGTKPNFSGPTSPLWDGFILRKCRSEYPELRTELFAFVLKIQILHFEGSSCVQCPRLSFEMANTLVTATCQDKPSQKEAKDGPYQTMWDRLSHSVTPETLMGE
jgi:hypothetical protein